MSGVTHFNASSNVLIGPLTTTFSPPTGCLSTITSPYGSPNLYLAKTGEIIDPNCYPTDYTTDDIYSPGFCPSGWSSACTPLDTDGSPYFTFSATSVSVYQCCPTGFSCAIWANYLNYYFCTSNIPTTSIPLWIVGISSGVSIQTLVTTIPHPSWKANTITSSASSGSAVQTITTSSSPKVYAKPIFVAYQSTDTQVVYHYSPSLRPTSVSATSDASTNSGLSTGAKIAIGVVVPLVVIFSALLVGFFILRHRRRRKLQMQNTAPIQTTQPMLPLDFEMNPPSEQKRDKKPVSEMPDSSRTELPSPQQIPPVELPTSLPVSKSSILH
ncbi:MAG: hypothetical protein M1834_003017 [Cirrosporium novae-zelandiae]|nr:MAG: hypothetical protein M1834_003017 [Cirrosporium novae-zelandiae]